MRPGGRATLMPSTAWMGPNVLRRSTASMAAPSGGAATVPMTCTLVGTGEPIKTRRREALAGGEEVRDLGEERRGDRVLRHVRVDALPVTDAAFGIEVSGEAPEATLDAWVGEDGIPTELRVRPPTLTLTIPPTAFGAAAPIPEPYELTTF